MAQKLTIKILPCHCFMACIVLDGSGNALANKVSVLAALDSPVFCTAAKYRTRVVANDTHSTIMTIGSNGLSFCNIDQSLKARLGDGVRLRLAHCRDSRPGDVLDKLIRIFKANDLVGSQCLAMRIEKYNAWWAKQPKAFK